MRDPRAVVTGFDLAEFVLADALHCLLVRVRVVANWYLRCHPTHRMDAASMAGVNQEFNIRAQKRLLHRDSPAFRERVLPMASEFLDKAEYIVPPPTVKTGGVIAELIKDLIHFECSRDSLDQNRRPNGSIWDSYGFLCIDEHVIPQPCLAIRFHLRQVKTGGRSATKQRTDVVKEIQSEVEE